MIADPQTKSELIVSIQRSWDTLNQFISGCDLTAPDSGGWRILDNLAHIAEWERFILRSQFQGLSPADALGIPQSEIAPFDVDRANTLLFERNRERFPEDVLADLHTVHAQLLAAIETSSEEKLAHRTRIFDDEDNSVLTWTLYNTRDHYDEHLQTMLASQAAP